MTVSRYGKQCYSKAFGYRDIATNAPLETDNIFKVASCTKIVTAACVMKLVEKGMISLDDDVGMHVVTSSPSCYRLLCVQQESVYVSLPL